MDFKNRFKGRTSVMDKSGIVGIVKQNGAPINKQQNFKNEEKSDEFIKTKQKKVSAQPTPCDSQHQKLEMGNSDFAPNYQQYTRMNQQKAIADSSAQYRNESQKLFSTQFRGEKSIKAYNGDFSLSAKPSTQNQLALSQTIQSSQPSSTYNNYNDYLYRKDSIQSAQARIELNKSWGGISPNIFLQKPHQLLQFPQLEEFELIAIPKVALYNSLQNQYGAGGGGSNIAGLNSYAQSSYAKANSQLQSQAKLILGNNGHSPYEEQLNQLGNSQQAARNMLPNSRQSQKMYTSMISQPRSQPNEFNVYAQNGNYHNSTNPLAVTSNLSNLNHGDLYGQTNGGYAEEETYNPYSRPAKYSSSKSGQRMSFMKNGEYLVQNSNITNQKSIQQQPNYKYELDALEEKHKDIINKLDRVQSLRTKKFNYN